jgi:hypothetical protein
MYGGITGFGYGNSLGGLLLGGVAVKDMSPQQLATYRARLAAQKKERAVLRAAKGLAPYGSLKDQPRVSRRKFTADQEEARKQLKYLIDAEAHAAALEEQAGHPQEAKYLIEDRYYNDSLYQSNKTPSWLTKKYTDPDPFGLRQAPLRKQRRDDAIQAAKQRREAIGMTKILNPATGRMVYPDSKVGQRVLHSVGPRLQKGIQYN